MFRGTQPSIDTGDAVVDEAVDILQLLHMEELRETQTRIIAAIVADRQLLLIQRETRAGVKQEGDHFRILASHPPSTNGNNVRPGKCLEIQLHTFKESIPENRLCFRDLPSLLFLY